MNNKTLKEIEEKYNLELNGIISEIRKIKAKIVLLQFPDSLKPYAKPIVDFLAEKTDNKVEFLIWFGSCFGACDTPTGLEKISPKIDLAVQFGHNELLPNY